MHTVYRLTNLTHQDFILLLFNSLSPTHTHITVTYIFNVIVQVLPVFAACVDLGKDISHELTLRIPLYCLLHLVSGRGLEKLRQGSLPITVLMRPSKATQTVKSTITTSTNYHPPREALLSVVSMECHRGQRVVWQQGRVLGSRDLQQVRQL